MLSLIFNDKFINKIADKISQEIEKRMSSKESESTEKLELILKNIDRVSLEIKNIEARLTQKELRDKTEYGQLKYQLIALQNELRPKRAKAPELKAH